MKILQSGMLAMLLCYSAISISQNASFDSFISRVSSQYDVDVALAPELIPLLDSLQKEGNGFTGVDDFLKQILKDKNVAYQVIDGNKILLRRETRTGLESGKILINGLILDKINLEPLPYVAVSIEGTKTGTYSDEQGRFSIYVDNEETTLQANYLGFKPQTIPAGNFMTGQLQVEMEPDQFALSQVMIIVPYHQMSSNSEHQALDLKGYQFISQDELLAHNTEKLIGQLTGYTHFSSEEGIRIRGSEEENSLIIMDGITVYDPYRFYNIFSPFNGHYFSEVSLYKNNMPVEYGGRVDGMIELKSIHDNSKPKLILDSDLLLTSLAGQIPVTSKMNFTAGLRISHTAILNAALSDTATTNFTGLGQFRSENEWTSSQQPIYDFYDINMGLNGNIGRHQNFSLNYFKSNDNLDNHIRNDLTTSLPNGETILFRQSIKNKDDWQNEGFSIHLQSDFSENTELHLSGNYSLFEKGFTYHSIMIEKFPNMTRTRLNNGLMNNTLQSGGFKAFIYHHEENAKGYTLGLDLQRHNVDLIATENTTPYLLAVQEELEATLFGEHSDRLFDKINTSIGGRITYLTSTSKVYLQPNLKINVPTGDWILKSSYSRNIQSVRELTVENRFGREVEFLALSQPDAGYPVMIADKIMAGATFKGNRLNIDGELYYKKTGGLIYVRALRPDPTFGDETSPQDFYRFFTGEGWTAGF